MGPQTLTLLVRVSVPRHHGTDGWEGDAGHGSHSSCCPHHPGEKGGSCEEWPQPCPVLQGGREATEGEKCEQTLTKAVIQSRTRQAAGSGSQVPGEWCFYFLWNA